MSDPGLGEGLAALFVLVFVFLAARAFVRGTRAMFAWAGQSGPIGVMLMLALWIFALPFMAVLAVIGGFLGYRRRGVSHRAEEDT